MTTAERLNQYHNFDGDLVATIADVAAEQNKKSFAELANDFNLDDNYKRVTAMHYTDRPFELLHLAPQDYDETAARVLYAPIAQPLDENMLMRAMRLYASDPSEQLFVIGSPTYWGHGYNRPHRNEVVSLAAGDFAPLALPMTMHLKTNAERQKIERLSTLGYSGGVEGAVALSSVAKEYGITTERGVWVEPASAGKRSWSQLASAVQLVKDFTASGEQLDRYVTNADSAPLLEARELARVSLGRYATAFLRPTNQAIVWGMARGELGDRALEALWKNPDMYATLGWGSMSEITDDYDMFSMVERLRKDVGERVGSLVLRGMHHAGGDDIDLHAAMMLQGLRGPANA